MAGLARRGLKRSLYILVYLLVVLAIALAVDAYRSSDLSTSIPSQSATLRTLNGDVVNIVEQSYEQPVLLYFWATWCPYCDVVSPMVEQVADDYAVVSVAFSSGPDEQVASFVADKGYPFTTVNDPLGMLANHWGVSVTPTLLIIRDGQVHSTTTGLTTSWGMRARLELAR